MSSQRPGGAGKGKKSSKPAESKREDVLQAVVITDSFQDRYQPFTVDKPRCLLPLANTPLIEYTLEFLAMNGVQEVFLYPGSHIDQVEDYISRSRWSPDSGKSPFSNITFVRVSDAHSVGDFLRDLDGRGYIDGDFILVHGDLVSNFSLDKALAAHKARREATATNIMTVVLRPGGVEPHRTKTNGITPVFVVDSKTNRILHYDETHPLQSEHYLTLDPAILDELSTDFEVRSDLIDAQVDICTPEVLALWSESFDYELPRRNYLHGVLKDWELNGKAIFAEIIDDGYAARASNLQMYESVSKDILSGWTYPFIPDCNVLPGQSYQRKGHGVSAEDNVEIASSTKVKTSIIGRDTRVGPASTVTGSVIGKRCRIGKNVTITDSYIWDDATVEDGAVVTRSILGYATTVGKGASVAAGCLLSSDVIISESINLPESTVVASLAHDGTPIAADPALVGPSGKGAAYTDPEADDVDPEDPAVLQKSLIYSLAHLNLSASSLSTLNSDIDSDSDDESESTPFSASRQRLSSFASDDSGSGGRSAFHQDAVHGLLEALRDDNGDFEPAKLEFMGLRLSTDASDAQMRKAVAVAFSRRAAELLTPEHGSLDSAAAAKKTLTRKGAAKFVDEVGVSGGETEQVEFVYALQRSLLTVRGLEHARAGTLLSALLQKLYELDVLEEEGIMSWWADERSAQNDELAAVREKSKVLIDWLEDAEEESDESDDE
ncbi:eIF4-gamma/eIF5/eIF2-epsilon [Plectosphaerella cucumerina]|uniref:Translation initiation factor eIF2B subunit epsilon n=1 Tax=Plectosphaerella cucumerina TaxID=40658 RepID=A0A8K0X3G6_9PEZI|nr:eIF4-gamma/eIF5/eIF2-epsilon [Plectosphaerella cucumerina]